MSDWTGNKNSIYTTLGASSHSNGERESDDYYATEPKAASMLLELEELDNILEPSCGEGHLASVFKLMGKTVTSSDLIDRGYGEVKDFFEWSTWDGDIVTNPPYKYAQEFIEHSIDIIPNGRKVAMFLKLQFLEGKKRKKMFAVNPPKKVYVSSSRIKCAINGEFDKVKSSAVAYAWFVWEKGFDGNPEIEWFN
jgi:hypothetical protein